MEKPVDRKYPSVRAVSEAERIGMVKEMFSTITGKYDFLNHFLSLRRDIAWRRFTVKKMRFFKTMRFLDVACGTADLSIDAAMKYGGISVTGADFVFEMLEL
ncbi:MAG TPA: class I SAM-dependent methyltransferase, partial [Syntrophorhabdaceae bacterium]|nr:class I SAM-dependent methyltransferase [Syntrophorhabdaceae bacterium]